MIPSTDIPRADAASLGLVLHILLHLPKEISLTLATQCMDAIADLPDDSQPCTYDGLIDVARFCVEEEPGWREEEQTKLISQFPRLRDSTRLDGLYQQYETLFPGLRYVAVSERGSQVVDEIESVLHRTASNNVHLQGSDAWKAELERNLDALWELSLDRATALEEGRLKRTATPDAPPSKDDAFTDSTKANPVAADDNEASKGKPDPVTAQPSSMPPADDETEPFLSLASFRALAVASPVLQKFFEQDLVHSIHLEPVQRSSTGGAFAWHAAPVAPRGTPRAVAGTPSKTPNGTVSLTSTLMHGNATPLDADTPASYSRDITTGTRGKVVGFLGGLLGEEGKTRMDALADQVALRLQTHSVKGPLPSFATEQPPASPEKPKSIWGNALMRGATAAAGVVTGESGTRPSLGGRLVGALRRQAKPDEPGTSSPSVPESTRDSIPASDEVLADQGPEAAVASLRAANEALAQERDTFIIDEVQTNYQQGDAEEDDQDLMSEVAEGIDALGEREVDKTGQPDSSVATGQLQGHEAQRAQGMYGTQ